MNSEQSTNESQAFDLFLVGGFSGFSLVSCLCSFMTLTLSQTEADDSYILAPFFMGFAFACLGAIGFVVVRKKTAVPSIPFVVSLVLWILGATTFAFGLTATLIYDEPNEFLPNLRFALALCFAPGILLILLSFFLFAFEIRRNRQPHVEGESASTKDYADWVQDLKEDEPTVDDIDPF